MFHHHNCSSFTFSTTFQKFWWPCTSSDLSWQGQVTVLCVFASCFVCVGVFLPVVVLCVCVFASWQLFFVGVHVVPGTTWPRCLVFSSSARTAGECTWRTWRWRNTSCPTQPSAPTSAASAPRPSPCVTWSRTMRGCTQVRHLAPVSASLSRHSLLSLALSVMLACCLCHASMLLFHCVLNTFHGIFCSCKWVKCKILLILDFFGVTRFVVDYVKLWASLLLVFWWPAFQPGGE